MLGVIFAQKLSQTNVVCLQAIAKVNENIYFFGVGSSVIRPMKKASDRVADRYR